MTEEKYELKNFHDKFHNELNLIFKDFLNANLGKEESTENDYKASKKMQELLNLSETDFNEIYEPQAISVFENTMKETILKSQKYDEDEENKSDYLKESLGINPDKASEITGKIRTKIVTAFYNEIIEDIRISPDEIEQADKLCNALHIIPKFSGENKKGFEKLKRLWVIENGEMPVIEPDIILPKNEVCYLQCEAALHENRKVTKSVGYAGPTFRVKIMKGVYYRAGNLGVSRHTEDELTKIDEGILHVTNKRILFVGSKQNKTYRYNQIIDLNPFNDGVQLVKDSGKSPFFSPAEEEPEILLGIIARVIKESLA